VDPVFGVDSADVGVTGGLGAEKVVEFGDAVVEEFVVDEAEFFGGEYVSAEVEIVAFVVDEFEGEHRCNQFQSSTGHTKVENDITTTH